MVIPRLLLSNNNPRVSSIAQAVVVGADLDPAASDRGLVVVVVEEEGGDQADLARVAAEVRAVRRAASSERRHRVLRSNPRSPRRRRRHSQKMR